MSYDLLARILKQPKPRQLEERRAAQVVRAARKVEPHTQGPLKVLSRDFVFADSRGLLHRIRVTRKTKDALQAALAKLAERHPL